MLSNDDSSKPKRGGGFLSFFANSRFGSRPAAARTQPVLPDQASEGRAASPEVDYDTVEATVSSAAALASEAAVVRDERPSCSSPGPTLSEIPNIPEFQPALETSIVGLGDVSLMMDESSNILTEEEMTSLSRELPQRLLCCQWIKAFFTSRDGFSLGSLYRTLQEHKGRPALLLVRDMNSHRFGAFVNEAFRISQKSFGCGETFVFSLNLALRVWKWTILNNFFVLCSRSSLCVGIDDGKFAIYLDQDLDWGRSQACATFNNDPLTPTGDFQAAEIEVWTFE